MDGAPWISADVAQGKAWTAAAYGTPSAAQKAKMDSLPNFSTALSAMTSGRYTPPIPHEKKVSPPWVPILMFTMWALGMLTIILNYVDLLPGGTNNWYLLLGLAFIPAVVLGLLLGKWIALAIVTAATCLAALAVNVAVGLYARSTATAIGFGRFCRECCGFEPLALAKAWRSKWSRTPAKNASSPIVAMSYEISKSHNFAVGDFPGTHPKDSGKVKWMYFVKFPAQYYYDERNLKAGERVTWNTLACTCLNSLSSKAMGAG